jgi:DNA-binding response OmpR family regulator
MEVLLIEDSVPDSRITIQALRREDFDHRLTWLRDGNEASEFLQQSGRFLHAPRPDLILLDLGLPGKDGRDLLTEIKSDDRLKSIPVVVITVSTDDRDRVRSESLNVEAYLVKPVDYDKFLDVVRRLKTYWKADMMLPPGVHV